MTDQDKMSEEFKPRYFNPSSQDVDEAMWCVRTNPPHTCAHDPECRDVFYAEVLRLRAVLANEVDHHVQKIDRLKVAEADLSRRAPVLSEEEKEALIHEKTGKCWPKCGCDYEDQECNARAMSVLAALVRRLLGESEG